MYRSLLDSLPRGREVPVGDVRNINIGALIGRLLSNHYRTMRLLLGVVGAAALATALGACAAISGLSAYSTGDCATDGCDASTHSGTGDGTVDTGVTPGADSPVGADSDAGPGDDGESGSGCAGGLLTCEGGCADPSSASTCGSCDNACGGDAALCASAEAGSFACASSCPSNSPTDCGGRCVDTSNDPANCTMCGNACTTNVANAHATCNGACSFACDSNYAYCGSSCVDFMTDSANCGGCGASHACASSSACMNGVCVTEQSPDAGADAGSDASVACPDGGCPNSTATGFSCPFGSCNGNSSECTTPGGCFCSNDNQCLSAKCVKVTGENDVSCDRAAGGGVGAGSGGSGCGRDSADQHGHGRDARRIRLRAGQPGHPGPRHGRLCVPDRQRLREHHALVRPHPHQLLLHRRQPVPEREMHPQHEQRELLRLLRQRHRGLQGMRVDCHDRELPYLHRVPRSHGMPVSDLLLHLRRGLRQRPLHTELSQRELLRLHRHRLGRRSRLRASPKLGPLHGQRRHRVHHYPHACACPQLRTHGVPLRCRLGLLERQVRQRQRAMHRHVHRERLCRQRGLPYRDVGGELVVLLARQLRQRVVAERHVHVGGRPMLVHERRPVPERYPVRQLVWLRVGRLLGDGHGQRVPLRPVMGS